MEQVELMLSVILGDCMLWEGSGNGHAMGRVGYAQSADGVGERFVVPEVMQNEES